MKGPRKQGLHRSRAVCSCQLIGPGLPARPSSRPVTVPGALCCPRPSSAAQSRWPSASLQHFTATTTTPAAEPGTAGRTSGREPPRTLQWPRVRGALPLPGLAELPGAAHGRTAGRYRLYFLHFSTHS